MEKRTTTPPEMRSFLKHFFICIIFDAYIEEIKTKSELKKIRKETWNEEEKNGLLHLYGNFLKKVAHYNMSDFEKEYSEAAFPTKINNGYLCTLVGGGSKKQSSDGIFDALFRDYERNEDVFFLFYFLKNMLFSIHVGDAAWAIEKDNQIFVETTFRYGELGCQGKGFEMISERLSFCFGWRGKYLLDWPTEAEMQKADFLEILKRFKEDGME